MSPLSFQQILQENHTSDPSSITALLLNQKALSDVSCLSDFKNLERLDLGFNNISSLEGLRPCINLKWLSVSQNKLQSLRGIENLSKLTVLNAGRNKLRSMDEVRTLFSLRALILNDNDISSICRLDQLKDLNTLVLSRNPIQDMGDSLVKLKSITKLSLSNCQIEIIGSSILSLLDLKEVRLAHNSITTLPAELAHNIKLRNLDLGNNLITRCSDLKVLSSLHSLRNLNLQGNPVTEKEKLANKIKNLVPDLQVFNNRPIVRSMKNEDSKRDVVWHKINDSSLNYTTDLIEQKEVKIENLKTKEISIKISSSQNKGIPLDNARVFDVEREVKRKKSKTNKISKKEVSSEKEDGIVVEKELKRKKAKKVDNRKFDPIDDGETPFMELIISDSAVNPKDGTGKNVDQEASLDVKSHGGVVTFPAKRKKTSKNLGVDRSALHMLSPSTEIGMGGPSTWET